MVLSRLAHFGPAATVTKIWPLSWTCFTMFYLCFAYISRTESKNKSKVGKIKMMAKMAHPSLLGRQVLTRYAAFVAVRWLRQMEGAWEWKWKPFWTIYIYTPIDPWFAPIHLVLAWLWRWQSSTARCRPKRAGERWKGQVRDEKGRWEMMGWMGHGANNQHQSPSIYSKTHWPKTQQLLIGRLYIISDPFDIISYPLISKWPFDI